MDIQKVLYEVETLQINEIVFLLNFTVKYFFRLGGAKLARARKKLRIRCRIDIWRPHFYRNLYDWSF